MSTCKIWWRSDDARPSYCVFFDFQNGGRPPSWIWYDVIADHPRLVFDDTNFLLKLHLDRVCTLQDIAIFLFGPIGLKLHAYSGPFWRDFGDSYPKWIQILLQPPKEDRPWAKTRRMSHKPWKSIHGFDLGACPRKIQYNQVTNQEKSHKP